MYNNTSIIQLTQFSDYKLTPKVQEALKDLAWRIQSNKFLELFAEIEGETILGIGISWLNSFHPDAKYIRIISEDNVDLFLEKLLQTVTQKCVIYSCWEDDFITGYLKKRNFNLFRKTYMEIENANELMKRFNPPFTTVKLLSLKDILNKPLLEKELFLFLKENYENTHLHNPVKQMSWQLWKDTLLEDSPDLELSTIAVENQKIVGYIFLHQGSATLYEVGWMGSLHGFDLHVILFNQLHRLVSKGIKDVEFEIDTTDHHAFVFSHLLNLQEKRSWHSYIYETNS